MAMQLCSEAFGTRDSIPVVNACAGADQSPPLRWEGAPEGTHSFGVICHDPDAPEGAFTHWAVFDIPADTGYLEEGHGTHRYHLRIFALAVPHLEVEDGAGVPEVERAAQAHVLGEARLIATFER
ncbi:YbhB/YbcL family Raf kinase inhibitor-like protein [Thiohalorhabdus sp. Cl-TMA]|uniref:YbhB/YbcL family Raf kinase inhibitor-like protein n=1 Tax=Thiohalorhabdus methylotrophus TaxID=3242694 RepID=A0ABV4TV13_9GAMM